MTISFLLDHMPGLRTGWGRGLSETMIFAEAVRIALGVASETHWSLRLECYEP